MSTRAGKHKKALERIAGTGYRTHEYRLGTMSLSIRERSQKVADYLEDNAVTGIGAIAAAVGISKSSAHRHQQGILRRQQQEAESGWWETTAGSRWLKLIVLGVVYYFGIKQGVGAERLSEFLQAVRLDQHVGSSASALRTLKQQMQQAIIAYEEAQSSNCQPKAGTGICVGGDETFFGGLPILVMMELASGFILTEVACENRTYQTWSEQIVQWWSQTGWQCHFMVSDGAQALIKLAVTGLGCVSVADLFHALRALAKPLGSAIGRQISQLQTQQAKLQQQVALATDATQQQALRQALDSLGHQQHDLAQAQHTYQSALHTITQAVHPFQIETLDWHRLSTLAAALTAPLQALSTLALTYGTDQANTAIDTFRRHTPALAQGIHAWWQWVTLALAAQTDDLELQNWVITSLLPWVYWQQQADKTRHRELKHRYQQAAQQAYTAVLNHALTAQLDDTQRQHWVGWCQWMAAKYQRTSSAVEGRNGYLSRLHQAGRGFSDHTLQVLTIIHNFDLKRTDGTTAAQRLFDHDFPNLFAWVVEQMGDLPMPRQSSQSHRPNPLSSMLFPA